jgi:hypothetical protein
MRLALFIIFVLTIVSCKKKSILLTTNDSIIASAIQQDPERVSGVFNCNKPEDYAPDPAYPTLHSKRLIKMVFHIMNATSRKYNYEGEKAITYFTSLLDEANNRLGRNEKLNLPVGNDYPVLDPGYRYELYKDPNVPKDDGFYFHYDDELYYFINKGVNKNNYKKDVIRKYAFKEDSIINVFVMPHHPDSIASPTYPGYGSGIALGTSLKISGIFESGAGPHAFSSMFNHEVGHILGLQHAWLKYDGCDDTPVHANCYGQTGVPPCDGVISNNMMDYNFAEIALSPCQIGKIHKNISRLTSKQRKLVQPSWCLYKKEMSVEISESLIWNSARDVEGDIIIKKGGSLTLKCRLSMPKASRIIVEPGGTLIINAAEIHNSCGDSWKGIELQTKMKNSGSIIIMGKPVIRDLEGDASKA